ncbi:MAG: hypothetical protein RJQ04_05485 [Longimicrobiales bacterium]
MPTLRTALLPTLLLALAAAAPTGAAAQDKAAAEAAKKMFDARTEATEAATQLKRAHRASDADVIKLLAGVGYRPDAVARASVEALRADAPTTARLMAGAGLGAADIAGGMVAGARIGSLETLQALDAARVRGAATPDVYRASRVSADDLTGYLRARGEAAPEAAATIMDVNRLRADAVTAPLAKHYAVREVGLALKETLRYDGDKIRTALTAEGISGDIVQGVLRDLGYSFGEPGILSWRIRDYEMGAGPGDFIENAQIVDRPAVLQGASSVDGVVWIEGPNLDHPDVEVWAGTTGSSPVKAEIRSRENVGLDRDRLEVMFPSMPAAGFRVVTPGGEAEVGDDAWPVGYAAIDRDLFELAMEGLSVSVDAEVVVEIAGGTITMPLPEHRENGIEVNVLDMNDDGFGIGTESEPGGAALVVTIPFEENGREIEGHFFGYIPCWKCGTLEIPRAECSSLSLNCVLGFLGETLANLGTCANLANWEEVEVLDLAGIPFEGDLSNTELEIRMGMTVGASGLESTGTTYDFATNVSLAANGDDVDVGLVDPLVRSRVSGQLNAAMEEIDLAVLAVNALNQYAGLMGFGTYLSMAPMPNGRLFVSYPAG